MKLTEVTLINHHSAPARLHQFRAGCPHVDLTIPRHGRRRVLTDETGARTLLGLANGMHQLSTISSPTDRECPAGMAEGAIL